MTHFIFDTETSGLISSNYEPLHPQQGRLMQIACLLLDDDFKEISVYNSYVELPEHTIIAEKAFEAHSITGEMCHDLGVPNQVALIVIDGFSCKSDYQVAHNMMFDSKVIANEETIVFGGPVLQFKKPICTMQLTTDLCKLDNPRYPEKFKWPKLEEAYKHLFNEEIPGKQHDALTDARACARIYSYLWKEGFIAVDA